MSFVLNFEPSLQFWENRKNSTQPPVGSHWDFRHDCLRELGTPHNLWRVTATSAGVTRVNLSQLELK